jgi:gamma-glutamyl phosphate reductase
VVDPEIINLVSHSKLDYPAACNSLEVLYIHKQHLSSIKKSITTWSRNGVNIVVGSRLQKSLEAKHIQETVPCSTPVEYGDAQILLEIVESHQEALQLINQYGSHHTDLILTDKKDIYDFFSRSLMSASVFQMVSTRCADGFRMGMGCELGINTNRSSWFRGPIGIEGLLTTQLQLRPMD